MDFNNPAYQSQNENFPSTFVQTNNGAGQYSSQNLGVSTTSVGMPGWGRSNSAMYNAFENFERQNRQRKYLIAECEDTITNLKLELDEVSKENKALETDCEKLEMEANACEVKYEKMLKDKTLAEAEYRTLSAEMDIVMESIARKRAQVKELEQIHEERVQLVAKAHNDHLTTYRQHPTIARHLELNEENKRKETEIQKLTEELGQLEQEFNELQSRYANEWDAFAKKCVEMAKRRLELKNKLQQRDKLSAEFERKSSNQQRELKRLKLGLGLENNQGVVPSPKAAVSGMTLGLASLQRSSRVAMKMNDAISSRIRHRPSPFQQMDRIFKESSSFSKFKGAEPIRAFNSSGSTNSGTTILTELRSRLKGTVMVSPMPRNQEKQTDLLPGPEQQNHGKDAEQGNGPLYPQQDPKLTNITSAPTPVEHQIPAKVVNFLEPPPLPSNSSNPGKTVEIENYGYGNASQLPPPSQNLMDKAIPPQTQQGQGAVLSIATPPILPFEVPQSQADQSQFNFFGGGFNNGVSSPPGGGNDFFGVNSGFSFF